MYGGNILISERYVKRFTIIQTIQKYEGNLRIKTLRITIKNDIHATPSRRGYYGMIGTKVYSYNRHGLLVNPCRLGVVALQK